MSSSSTITEANRRDEGLGRRAHPGEVLADLYLDEWGIDAAQFAERIGLPADEVQDLLDAKKSFDAVIALRVAKAVGNTPQLWMNMQSSYDLFMAERRVAEELAKIEPFPKEDAA